MTKYQTGDIVSAVCDQPPVRAGDQGTISFCFAELRVCEVIFDKALLQLNFDDIELVERSTKLDDVPQYDPENLII